MKKILTLAIFIMTLCMPIIAQNYEEISITTINGGSTIERCSTYDSIRINQDETCPYNAGWTVCNMSGTIIYFDGDANHITLTPEMDLKFHIFYTDCYTSKDFSFNFFSFESIPEPWAENEIWLSPGETRTLEVYYSPMLNYLWPDGSTDWEYTITGPEKSGKIWIRMYNDCGAESDTINVYYNGDIAMATVDPQTDHIIVTWEVDPLLAVYLENVIIVRDGYQIATVPYIQGQYIDEAVSGSATSRTYRCKAIAKDGSVCDFNSTPKPSIHMVYTVGYFGTVEMQFNDVSSNYEDLFQYYISQWSNGEITHVDSIMPGRLRDGESLKTALGYVTMRDGVINYSAPESYFSDGYLIVEADLNGSKNRDVAGKFLSNRSENTVGIHEVEGVETFNIYPNPSNGVFNIQTDREMTITIYSLMGQVVAIGRTQDGVFSTDRLSPGVYFVKSSEGHIEKVVVE